MVCASEDPAHAGICGRTGFCNVNLLWVTVRDASASALDSITLADLAAPASDRPIHTTQWYHHRPPSRAPVATEPTPTN